jgi:hypothetical protein
MITQKAPSWGFLFSYIGKGIFYRIPLGVAVWVPADNDPEDPSSWNVMAYDDLELTDV